MPDYQAHLAKDREEFGNIARVKLREVCRRDISSFADVERVVDLLGEWMVRLSDVNAGRSASYPSRGAVRLHSSAI